jgi:hypothetical protein
MSFNIIDRPIQNLKEAVCHMSSAPTLVRICRRGGKVVQDCDVYIGRACNQGGWRLPASVWANKNKVGGPITVDKACRLFAKDLGSTPTLMSKLPELKGKRLGCWCEIGSKCSTCGKSLEPRTCGHYQCHGEVIIEQYKMSAYPTGETKSGTEEKKSRP